MTGMGKDHCRCTRIPFLPASLLICRNHRTSSLSDHPQMMECNTLKHDAAKAGQACMDWTCFCKGLTDYWTAESTEWRG